MNCLHDRQAWEYHDSFVVLQTAVDLSNAVLHVVYVVMLIRAGGLRFPFRTQRIRRNIAAKSMLVGLSMELVTGTTTVLYCSLSVLFF